MCAFGGPKPPPVPPPPPAPAREPDAAVQQARTDQQRRARAAQGYSSTIATGPMGLSSPASTGFKSLLGQ
jgi:hypothetical protein